MGLQPPLFVGVVGLGVGEQHARMYADLSDCRVRWLFDHSEEKAREVRDRIGEGDVAPALDTILDDEDIAVVSVASYDRLHYDEVLACLAAGKNVFVEKPLCRTIDELATLSRHWESRGKRHLVSNLVLREAEIYRWLKSAIADGRMGQIYAIDGDYLYGRLEKITAGWRKDVPDYSVMEGGGVHMIDLMLDLADEYPTHVSMVGNKICTAGTDFRYDDFMAATFRFQSGLIGRITANFGCVHRHHHILRVFGTKATFVYDDMGPRLHETRDEAGVAEPIAAATLPTHKGALIPAFIKAIVDGADPEPAARREFNLIAACAAADRSLLEQRLVEIEYP